jgi:hypothetical protein
LGIFKAVEASLVTTAVDRPVFVAANGRRARWLRSGGAVALVLACFWLVALAVGMLGIGRLPGVSLPSVVRGAEKGSSERAPAAADSSLPASPAVAAEMSGLGSEASERAKAFRQTPAARRTSAKPKRQPARSRTAPAFVPPVQTVQTPVATQPAPTPAPAPATAAKQGWARQGYTAPPGQSRETETQAPATPPAQGRRAETESTTAPAPPTPGPTTVPPGQQKKAEDPIPKG